MTKDERKILEDAVKVIERLILDALAKKGQGPDHIPTDQELKPYNRAVEIWNSWRREGAVAFDATMTRRFLAIMSLSEELT